MQKKLLSLAAVALAFGVIVAPSLTHAQFSTSTAVTTVTDFIGDLSVVIAGIVGGILALLAALVGLGWGIRKFLKWVGGRKF